MEAPINASSVIESNIIEKLLQMNYCDNETAEKLGKKYMRKLRSIGYKILMEKYNLADKKEILSCNSLYPDYTIMFEGLCIAIRESDLIIKVINGELPPEKMFTMTLDEMVPAANEDIRQEINIRQNIKIEMKTSKMYKCKCGCNETLVESKQIRRADEPPTVTARCISCGRKWVVGI